MPRKGYVMTSEHRANLSKALSGRKLSEQHSNNISLAKKGIKHSEQCIARLSESVRRFWDGKRKRDADPDYKGGRELKEWRKQVIFNCGGVCQKCGSAGPKIAAHHIKPWDTNPELRFEVSNGQALCPSCHLKTHNAMRPRTSLELARAEDAKCGMQRCRKCSRLLPFSEYSLSNYNSSGIQTICRECHRKIRKDRRDRLTLELASPKLDASTGR